MRLALIATAAVLCASSLAAHADAVYTYTGQDLSVVSGSNPNVTRVTGELTYDAPLPDNLSSSQYVAPESYSFTDGVQTLTQYNSSFDPAHSGNPIAWVSTDGQGNITAFTFFIFADLGVAGDSIDIVSGSDDFVENRYYTAESEAPGSFSGPTATVSATPEPSSLALLGTGLLGVVGVLRNRFA